MIRAIQSAHTWFQTDNPNFLVTFAIVLTFVFGGVEAHAQQPKKVPRIGFLSPTADDSRAEAFRQGLRELGYTDGQNLTIEYRWAGGRFDKLPELAWN